jgi:hypothetical protein
MDYTGMYQEILLSFADDEATLQSPAGAHSADAFPARIDRQSRGRRRQRTFELWAGAMMRWLHTAATNSMVISLRAGQPSACPWWAPWRSTPVAVPVAVLSRQSDGHPCGCNSQQIQLS